MADWFKDFDPLKNAELFNLGIGKGSGSAASTGVAIGKGINQVLANRRQRRQMEEEQAAERRRQDELVRNPPPLHGSAHWATASELRQAELLRNLAAFDDPASLVLGTLPGAAGFDRPQGQIHWDGEGHLLTVAPTRSGKSTMLIVPNLLRYRGSAIVLDPKGELYRDTSAWRAAHVGPVYRIAPFDTATDAFNPLEAVRDASDARALADLMIPDDPNAQDYFKKDAIAYLYALILFVTLQAPPERRSLAEIRAITAGPLETFLAVARAMAAFDSPAIRNAANIVLGKSRDRSLPLLRDTLNTELVLWDDPGVIRATSGPSINLAALKERQATLYITVPFEKTDAFAPFLKVLLTSVLDAMVQSPVQPGIPVLFVLDEFLSLGPFPKFRDAIRTHAGAGVRLWFFLQDISTLQEHYPASWKAFFNASVKLFFGTDEAFTAELISEWLGAATVAYRTTQLTLNQSTSTGPIGGRDGNQGNNLAHSVAFTGKPLLSPPEVVEQLSGILPDKTRNGILFVRGVSPVRTRLVPWFLGSICRARVGTKPSS